MTTISIVTVSMNRSEHLLRALQHVAKLNFHSEHIVIDFGSSLPINREDLPNDHRIKLYRTESPDGNWWLTNAFNLGFSLAESDYILKLDADVLLNPEFADALVYQIHKSGAHLFCDRLTNQDWHLPSNLFTTNGLFLCKRSSLNTICGFNPYIRGWGWDEIDLYSRFFLAGFPVSRLPQIRLDLIQHGDDMRESSDFIKNKRGPPFFSFDSHTVSKRLMSAHNEKNKLIAIASVVKKITWPTLFEYKKSYMDSSSLPILPRHILFDQYEYEHLLTIVARRLLNPTYPVEAIYRLLGKLRVGPYAPSNAKLLLDKYGINLTKVV